jgi:hypothetical protein
MDKTESTVRVMLTAIETPLYDVGVLSERGMLPGLDGISAGAVFDRLSLLKYRNANGSHIYIRPSGEHRYTTLDDLSETPLARLSATGFNPCAVVTAEYTDLLEREVRGKPAAMRSEIRRARARPLLDELHRWLSVEVDNMTLSS